MPASHIPFKSIVPLQEIIAESFEVISTASKKVQAMYEQMVSKLGSEFNILLDVKISDIKDASNDVIARGIEKMRVGDIYIRPGYDGVFGEVKIFRSKNEMPIKRQEKLI
jgi:PHP family Zn ribbon phosphoesterase